MKKIYGVQAYHISDDIYGDSGDHDWSVLLFTSFDKEYCEQKAKVLNNTKPSLKYGEVKYTVFETYVISNEDEYSELQIDDLEIF